MTGAAALAMPLAAFTPAATAAAHVMSHRMVPAIGNPVKFRSTGLRANADPTFSCESPTAAVQCYSPKLIRAAYNVPSNVTGRGRTIAIVDAFQSPTITSDLQAFDKLFSLPDPKLNIIAPDGLTPFDPANADQVGWAGEITLDVEWAHAIAPGARIDLVLAKSDNDTDIFHAQKFVINHNLGDTLSQSFGEAEHCMDPALLARTHALFARARAERMTVFASSGDDGSAQPTCDGSAFAEAVSTPASDPAVTGVGGTHLNADFSTGAYQSETTWNDQFGASGGGFSTIFRKPAYQLGVHSKTRGVPDVAYNADVNGGVLGVFSSSGQGANLVFIFGGTSAGSPQWAGIAALADQRAHHRVGFINPRLYLISKTPLYHAVFHDVTVGSNIWAPSGVTAGFFAAPGWDPVTGLGTPNVARVIRVIGGR